ncbi:MAG TPA: hypothetical protein VN153_04010 [Tahibacter sp.]|nr:hypothetical protein [Tahibacter sp.]
MSRTDRKLWAEQTLEILERGRYTNLPGETVELAAAITACRAATRLFPFGFVRLPRRGIDRAVARPAVTHDRRQ